MKLTPWPYPRWIAHRGAGKLAPENTLAAFRLGARYGYRAFECDVKLSRDNVPFLLHDATLDRTSSAVGDAAAQAWSALSQLDAGGWHSRAYAGEPLASLAAIAAYCLRNRHALNIEIKPSPGRERETGELVARETARLWDGQAVLPLLSSFKPDSLEGARATAAALPRALLVETLWDGWLERAEALGCVAVVANHKLCNLALVERLHGAGLHALAYTVNDETIADALLGFGIEGLITDAVDRFAVAEPRLVREYIPACENEHEIMLWNEDRHLAAEPGTGPGQLRAIAVREKPPLEAVLDAALIRVDLGRNGIRNPFRGRDRPALPYSPLKV